MKITSLASVAIALALLPQVAKADTTAAHLSHQAGTSAAAVSSTDHLHIFAAMEPASFLLVGFGMFGGVAVRRKLLAQAREER